MRIHSLCCQCQSPVGSCCQREKLCISDRTTGMSIILVGTSLPFEWDNLSPLVRIEFTNLPKFGEDQSSRPASYVPSALPELGLSALGLCSAVAAYRRPAARDGQPPRLVILAVANEPMHNEALSRRAEKASMDQMNVL